MTDSIKLLILQIELMYSSLKWSEGKFTLIYIYYIQVIAYKFYSHSSVVLM